MMPAIRTLMPCVLSALLASCESHVVQLEGSARVAGTLGSITAEPAPDNRMRLVILVLRMVRPEYLVPPAEAYVVWAREPMPTATPFKIGPLVVLENGTGRLDAYVAQHALEIFVTPESSLFVSTPEHAPVLHATLLMPAS
jgi:hypothetical protein